MHDLTEIDQLIIVCIIAGFISGALSAITDDISKLLIKNQRIKMRNMISKSIFSGFAMGLFLSSINFAFVSFFTTISTEELVRTSISSAISLIFAPIIANLLGLISSKLFPES
jgi:Mg/Co/Ni transporter MgtE